MSTCNRLDLETLGSWLNYAQELPGHCWRICCNYPLRRLWIAADRDLIRLAFQRGCGSEDSAGCLWPDRHRRGVRVARGSFPCFPKLAPDQIGTSHPVTESFDSSAPAPRATRKLFPVEAAMVGGGDWASLRKTDTGTWEAVFKIEALKWISFWWALKFQRFRWSVGSNPRRHIKNIEMKIQNS